MSLVGAERPTKMQCRRGIKLATEMRQYLSWAKAMRKHSRYFC
jgi:hypothetical protein